MAKKAKKLPKKLPPEIERLLTMTLRERCLHTLQVLAAEDDWEAAHEDALDCLWRYLHDAELEDAFNAVGTGRPLAPAAEGE